MDSQAQLSAIIVSATEADSVLRDCISALRTEVPDCEIVLVDNGGSKERLGRLAAEIGNAKCVSGHGNVGYGRGNNLGVRAAGGTHVLVVNPDTRLVSADHRLLSQLVAVEPFGIVAPLHLDPDGQERFHVYPGDRWPGHLFKEQVLAPLYPRELRPRKRYARPDEDGAWIGGAFTLFRKDEFEALGGFDGRYFLYYEDRDITNRYRRAGLPVRTDRALVAEHGEGASFADEEADVRRSLWRIMGWLQYVSIWNGRSAAAVALRVLLATYAVIGAVLSPVPPRGAFAARMRRKGRELHAVRAAVLRAEQLLPDPAAGAYPDVLALVAERSS